MKKIKLSFKLTVVDVLIALALIFAFGAAGYISIHQSWQIEEAF